jgi:hypothetical protein
MAVTLRLEEGGRESQHRLYRSRVSPLCLVLVLEVMKDSISKGLRRLTPQRIALLCGNIATDPETLKGLKEILNSRTVNSFEPSTISPRVWFNSSGLRHDRLEERACCYWSHRKSACYGESASPAKIPHRKYVDNLDEEVLYDDVQCTSMDFDKQQQPPQPRPTKNAPNKQRTIS